MKTIPPFFKFPCFSLASLCLLLSLCLSGKEINPPNKRGLNKKIASHKNVSAVSRGKKIPLPLPSVLSFVHPFIGTGGHGHTFPGAAFPFGMVQLSPDTRIDGSWDGCSGYHYDDTLIYGFSHTHLSGTGCSDYGDIAFLPLTNSKNWKGKAPAIGFSHRQEKASPGYYEVALQNGVQAAFSVSERAGLHDYRYPKDSASYVLLDLTHRDLTLACQFTLEDKRHISGMRRSKAWAANQVIYFYAAFSEDMLGHEIFSAHSDKEVEKILFEFAKGKRVGIRVGISMVSVEGAKLNLEKSAPDGFDLSPWKLNAEAAWEKELAKIKVYGGSDREKTNFYSALYHCMIQPNVMSDADGKYRGMDGKVHTANGFRYYSVFSLWDTFRAWHPLFTMIDQQRTRDFIQTFLCHFREGGKLPVWELGSNETDCMIGFHAASVIADALTKQISVPDSNELWKALTHSAEMPERGVAAFNQYHYLAAEHESESVSKGLEYAYNQWCVGVAGERLQQKEANRYLQRGLYYQNYFNAANGFMQGRENGNWHVPFDPKEVNNYYTEGNSWQYSFFVLQDIAGWIQLMGGKEKAKEKLDALFNAGEKTTGRSQADITGLIGQYAHGNEPSHHIAFLYNYVGYPDKCNAIIQKINQAFYTPQPDGLIGNEDCGQMSAWHVLSACGLYAVSPGFPYYTVCEPLFDSVHISLENGRVGRVIKRKGNAGYFAGCNGRPTVSLSHEDWMKGGTLVLDYSGKVPLSPQEVQCKTTSIPSQAFVPVPIIRSEGISFVKEQIVTLECVDKKATLWYYFGNDSLHPLAYTEPIKIRENKQLIAYAEIGNNRSGLASARWVKRPEGIQLMASTVCDPQYDGGGKNALIDGILGDADWRKGAWVGIDGKNFEGSFRFDRPTMVDSISVHVLQDQRSWIMYPALLEVDYSMDGQTFLPLGSVGHSKPDTLYNADCQWMRVVLPAPVKVNMIRVRLRNYGPLPYWHAGAGKPCYIFIDEIEMK